VLVRIVPRVLFRTLIRTEVGDTSYTYGVTAVALRPESPQYSQRGKGHLTLLGDSDALALSVKFQCYNLPHYSSLLRDSCRDLAATTFGDNRAKKSNLG
jgi:hypothetical protein